MAATTTQEHEDRGGDFALARVSNGSLAEGDQRSGLHPAELRTVRRRRVLPGACHGAHARTSGTRSTSCSSRSGKKGVLDVSPDSQFHHRPRPRLHRPRERNHRRPPDRGAAEARHHAERRLPHGRRARSRPTATSPIRTWSRHSPSTARPTTMPCSTPTPRTSAMPQLAHPHRAARRLRPRPHHRRLPPRRALRRRAAHRAQAAGEERRSIPPCRPTRSSAIARNWRNRSARSRN